MKEFIDSISSREQVILIVMVSVFVATLFSKSIRASFYEILKAFFVKHIIILCLLAFSYSFIIIFVFFKLNLWDKNLLKDTIIWAFGTALIMIFDSIKAKDFTFFKESIKDVIKWTIFIEFLTGFYTFSFLIELFLVPFLTFIALLIAYSDSFQHKLTDEEKRVSPILKNILTVIGLIIFAYTAYKTYSSSAELLTLDNLKSFLLPIVFTFLFIPFAYFVALYASYEDLWVRLKLVYTKEQSSQLKKDIFKVANLNLKKISNISQNLSKPTFVYNDFSLEMLKTISNGKYKGFDE